MKPPPPPLPSQWISSWIAVSAHPERNRYYLARRTVELSTAPDRATAWITADSRYRLWVNGRPVCRGPARYFPDRPAVDSVDVTALLREGRNVFALLVHQYGESTFAYVHRGGSGFLFQAEIDLPGEDRVVVGSDQWRSRRSEAWDPKSARTSVQTGFQEVYDARNEPQGWADAEFDDSEWKEVGGNTPVGVEPWLGVEARGIPLLREEPERATTIGAAFHGAEGAEARDSSRVMENFDAEAKTLDDGAWLRDRDAALRAEGSGARLDPPGAGDFRGFVVDFGREVAGCVRLEIAGADGGEILDLIYAERVDDDGLPVYPPPHPGWSLRMADRYVCRGGDQAWEGFALRGFRYLAVVARNVRSPIVVRDLHLNAIGYPVEAKGAFECSDPLLTRIWSVAARTLQLCMFDSYVDCPWREQAQWLGDAVVQGLTCFHVFGDAHLFRRTLYQASRARTHDGLLYGVYPSEAHGCVLPDYALTWILALDAYYTYTGDISLLLDTWEAATAVLERHAEHADHDGLLSAFPGRWLFLDWAGLDRWGYNATYSLLYVLALKTMVRIAAVLGRPNRRWVERFARARDVCAERFRDPGTGRFRENLDPDTLERGPQVSQHANAIAFLVGCDDRCESIVGAVMDGDLRPDDPVVQATSYFYFYVHAAMMHAGRFEELLDSIRRYWGPMLDAGATTFWEGFRLNDAGTSCCHAWSSGPAFHLSRMLLGVRPSQPAWRRFIFRPFDGGLAFARGRVPTPSGAIEVAWQRDDETGELDAEIVIPAGIHGIVGAGSSREGKILGAGRHHVRFTAGFRP